MRHEENRAQHIAQRKARYEQEDIHGKLLMNLRDTGHIMRGLSEGRGSCSRITRAG